MRVCACIMYSMLDSASSSNFNYEEINACCEHACMHRLVWCVLECLSVRETKKKKEKKKKKKSVETYTFTMNKHTQVKRSNLNYLLLVTANPNGSSRYEKL